MEGCVVSYLKEVRLAGNLSGQLQGTYVRSCIFTCVCAILESTPHVKCTQVTSLFRLATSNFTLRGQLRCHQVLVHSQAHHEFFAVRVVCVQWCTRVFLNFKSNCTVPNIIDTIHRHTRQQSRGVMCFCQGMWISQYSNPYFLRTLVILSMLWNRSCF